MTLASLQVLHWLVHRGERCILNVAYFTFPCAVWLGILFGLLHVSLHRELIYLTETRYMEVDSLPVEPACFSFLFFLIYVCLKKKKKTKKKEKKKKPPFRHHLC